MNQKNCIALHGHFVLLYALSTLESLPGGVSSNTIALNMEVATFGYTLTPEAGLVLSSLDDAAFHDARKSLLVGLAEVTGSDENFNVLFANFPHSTPDQHEYLASRVKGHLSRIGSLGHMPYTVGLGRVPRVVFSSGGVVMLTDGSSFSTSDFGVDPVTQFALPGVRADENVKVAHVRMADLKPLSVATLRTVNTWADDYLARGSSLSGQERELIEDIRSIVTPGKPSRVFRETLPILHSFHSDDREYIGSLLSSATDVLRIAVFMSDRSADLSLAEPTKFRISTSQRKELLRLLDGLESPEEDMLRRRERWLRLGEKLNPGTAENRKRYPVAARAFSMLRREPGNIASFNRVFEAGFRPGAEQAEQAAALDAVARRPGEAMRRLEWMLRRTGSEALPVIGKAVQRAAPRLLLKLSNYLTQRIDDRLAGVNTTTRAFPIKGMSNRFKIIDDTRPVMDVALLQAAQVSLAEEMHRRIAALPSLGKVYLDPELAQRIMPMNRRGASSASQRMDMGSAYPADDAPVLRLFTWWKGDIDVDLSANLYDADWDLLQSVGFYNTGDIGKVFAHSGDIQYAPEGAAEFIDVDKGKLLEIYPSARYLVMTLTSYRGQGFNTFPAFCGVMGRDALRSGRRFEPDEVLLRMDLNSASTNNIAGAWDILANRFIPVDVSMNSHRHSNALSRSDSISALTRNVVEMRDKGLTLYALAAQHAKARGQLVNTPDEADLVLDVDTFSIEQAEAWMDEAVPLPSSFDVDDGVEPGSAPRPL